MMALSGNGKRIIADCIIFDLDGTLIDSSGDIAWAANRTLESFGYPAMTVEEVKGHIGWGIRPLLEKLMPGEPPLRIEDARGVFLEFYGSHLVVQTLLYPGVVDTLRHFKSVDKRMAVVTNKPEGLSMRILDELGLAGYFAVVLGGDTVANKKPHPEPVERALSKAGAEPSRSVMVGDSPVDCEAGRAAGLSTIGVSYGFRGAEELKGAGCDIIINSFAELKDVLA